MPCACLRDLRPVPAVGVPGGDMPTRRIPNARCLVSRVGSPRGAQIPPAPGWGIPTGACALATLPGSNSGCGCLLARWALPLL